MQLEVVEIIKEVESRGKRWCRVAEKCGSGLNPDAGGGDGGRLDFRGPILSRSIQYSGRPGALERFRLKMKLEAHVRLRSFWSLARAL